MILRSGIPPIPRTHWSSFWSSYLNARTFTNEYGYDSMRSKTRVRSRPPKSAIDPHFAVALMTVGMVAFIAQKLVAEEVEPHPGPLRNLGCRLRTDRDRYGHFPLVNRFGVDQYTITAIDII